MRTASKIMLLPKKMARMAMRDRIGTHLRRGMNAIAHVLTPHGKQLAGRKGRKG